MNAIRLVNVIGSPGSVVPSFLRQIEEGSAITVTHPEARRWFLSLPETVDAILAAGNTTSRSIDGRILVPNPGDPIRISDLAKALGEASGRPFSIVFTGLRPGDKLGEELTQSDEMKERCVEGGLRVVKTRQLGLETLQQLMRELANATASYDPALLLARLRAFVPEFDASKGAP
jgi:O-antigen biosynthesis protein WbqV